MGYKDWLNNGNSVSVVLQMYIGMSFNSVSCFNGAVLIN